MDIESLLLILKEEFRKNLNTNFQYIKDKAVILSDAFYLQRHDVGISFLETISSEKNMRKAQSKLTAYFKSIRRKNPSQNATTYFTSIKMFKTYVDKTYGGIKDILNFKGIPINMNNRVNHYLLRWNTLENYFYQEEALNKLFHETYPYNKDIKDILIKVSCLNDFYSTNIYSPYYVAKHIFGLDIDSRLMKGDLNLVEDIAMVSFGEEKIIKLYSFATKYCSHHNENSYPIYDSYVDKLLIYYRNNTGFSCFENEDLRNFVRFHEILIQFQNYFGLQNYSLKEIDKFLWQQGKEFFKRNYSKKRVVSIVKTDPKH